MRRFHALPLLLAASLSLSAADYFVSPSGRQDSAGTLEQPWNLEYALQHPSVVHPGDTVWLRGGSYGDGSRAFESRLRGTAGEPVMLRQYPGERATLLSSLKISGSNAIYWGFEVFESQLTTNTEESTSNQLVHLVIHSTGTEPQLLRQAGADASGCLWFDEAGEPHFSDSYQMSRFERGRANVVARWNMGTGRLEVDAEGLLKPGAFYELYDARAVYGPAVARGVYTGAKIIVDSAGQDQERRLMVLMPGRKDVSAERSASASFLGLDSTTKGNWRGVYGQDGNYIAYHSYGYPSYSYPSTDAADVYLISNTSTDVRAPYRFLGDPSLRVASYAHTVTSMDWVLPATDNQPHRVALYFCDFQNFGRSISVDVYDNATSQLLDTRSLSDISGGVYLVYNYTGTVKFRIRNNLTGTLARTATAPLSAIFWGGTGVPVVDTTPPLVSVSSPANNASVLGTIALSATASDNVSVSGVQFKIDNVNFGVEDTTFPYSVNWNTTAVSNGVHSITATARDSSGLTASATISVTVNNPPPDTTLPDVSINSPTGGPVNGTLNIASTATDNVGVVGVQMKLDGNNLGAELPGPGPAFNYSWNTATATNGSHQLTAVARDAAGNFRTSAQVTVTVNNPDTTPPLVSLTSPSSSNVAGTITLTASASDNAAVAGVQFKVDGVNVGAEATTSPYSVSWNSASVNDGAHTITAVARDTAGLTATATLNVTVNNTSGVFASFLGADIATQGSWRGVYGQDGHYIAQFSYGLPTYSGLYSVTANQSLYSVSSLDPRAVQKPNPGYSERVESHLYSRFYIDMEVSTTDNQPHRMALYFVDWPGFSQNRTITVTLRDTVTGTVFDSRVVDSNNGYKQGVYLVYNYRGRVTIRVQNNYPPVDPNTNQPTLPNGTISAVFWGGAGIPTPDTTLPTVSMTNPSANSAVSGTVNLAATASDNVGVAGLEFKLDNVTSLANISGSGPNFNYSWNTSGVANGPHTISATARDAAGNTSTSTINVTVNNFVDTQPPQISFSSPAASAVVLNTIALQVNASDNVAVAGVQYKIDNVNLGAEVTSPPFSSSWNTATVANGQHVITAVARDTAGLTATATVTVNVNNFIDTVAPQVSFAAPSPADSTAVTGTVNFAASASDNVGVVEVRYILDGATVIGAPQTTSPYSVAWNTTTIGNGNHTIQVRATDAAGLTGLATITLNVNNVNPSGTFVTFLGQDLNTKGSWKGVYGQDGHMIVQNSYLYAPYASFNPRNAGVIVQNYYSTDPRALLKNVGQFSSDERIGSYLYGAPVAELDMRTTDSQIHRVSLYFADYENAGRSITVEVRDAATNAVLDTRVLSNYTNGIYLVYNYRGPITFRIINNLTGSSTLGTVSGVFWGGTGLP